jgi:hypothetical protein
MEHSLLMTIHMAAHTVNAIAGDRKDDDVTDMEMCRRGQNRPKRFRAKWLPVRVKKTRRDTSFAARQPRQNTPATSRAQLEMIPCHANAGGQKQKSGAQGAAFRNLW